MAIDKTDTEKETSQPSIGRLVPVSTTMGLSRWAAPADYKFLRNTGPLELVIAELDASVASLPIFVQKLRGELKVVCLITGNQNRSLISETGAFATSYVPAVARAYPFCLSMDAKGTHHLCVDKNSTTNSASPENHPFFDEIGQQSKPLKRVVSLLHHWLKARESTNAAAKMLDEKGLLKPNSELGPNLFEIDGNALGKIQKTDIDELYSVGALKLGYACLFSATNRYKLNAEFDRRKSNSPVVEEKEFESSYLLAFAEAADQEDSWTIGKGM